MTLTDVFVESAGPQSFGQGMFGMVGSVFQQSRFRGVKEYSALAEGKSKFICGFAEAEYPRYSQKYR